MVTKRTTDHPVRSIIKTIVDWQNTFPKGKIPEINGIVFSNSGALGREPLFDASENNTGDILAYWENKSKKWLCISHPESGYEIRAPQNMDSFFSGYTLDSKGCVREALSYLDVSHLDVSETTNFNSCFWGFGICCPTSKLVDLETWDISNGSDFSLFFGYAFPDNKEVNLDLSKMCFSKYKELNFRAFFQDFAGSAEKINLSLCWVTDSVWNFAEMFSFFGINAKRINIFGIEEWYVNNGSCFDEMFDNFALNGNCFLDLSNWKIKGKCNHEAFARGTFFKIKEPNWGIKNGN